MLSIGAQASRLHLPVLQVGRLHLPKLQAGRLHLPKLQAGRLHLPVLQAGRLRSKIDTLQILTFCWTVKKVSPGKRRGGLQQ